MITLRSKFKGHNTVIQVEQETFFRITEDFDDYGCKGHNFDGFRVKEFLVFNRKRHLVYSQIWTADTEKEAIQKFLKFRKNLDGWEESYFLVDKAI